VQVGLSDILYFVTGSHHWDVWGIITFFNRNAWLSALYLARLDFSQVLDNKRQANSLRFGGRALSSFDCEGL